MKRLLKKIIHAAGYITSLLLLITAVSSTPAYAGSTFSISPSSGTKSDDFTVSVIISSDSGDEVAGVDLDVDFTGPIEYVNSASGDVGCSASVTENSSLSLNVLCLGFPDYLDQSGTIVQLTFSPTGSGTATMTITVNDNGDVPVDGTSGSTYSITTGGTGGTGTTTGGTDGELPDTDGSSSSMIWLGLMSLLVGIGGLTIYSTFQRIEEPEHEEIRESLMDKVNNVR